MLKSVQSLKLARPPVTVLLPTWIHVAPPSVERHRPSLLGLLSLQKASALLKLSAQVAAAKICGGVLLSTAILRKEVCTNGLPGPPVICVQVLPWSVDLKMPCP